MSSRPGRVKSAIRRNRIGAYMPASPGIDLVKASLTGKGCERAVGKRARWEAAALVGLTFALMLGSPPAARAGAPPRPADPTACKLIRLADIGWTDVTATTALFSSLVRQLGYEAQITVLSVPVTYASMKNKDIDVFLGNWMPSMQADRKAYVAEGSVEVIGANLTGAKYTLAVPAYTYQAGLRDFADIHRFASQLKNSIYGIEPGNDGNRLVLGMLKQNLFGLGDFKLVESSEQGMLAQVERALHNREPIVFLAWEPHPMNMRFELRYLTGGDPVFGPNFGGATIYTNTRAGYSRRLPQHRAPAQQPEILPER